MNMQNVVMLKTTNEGYGPGDGESSDKFYRNYSESQIRTIPSVGALEENNF